MLSGVQSSLAFFQPPTLRSASDFAARPHTSARAANKFEAPDNCPLY